MAKGGTLDEGAPLRGGARNRAGSEVEDCPQCLVDAGEGVGADVSQMGAVVEAGCLELRDCVRAVCP